MRRKTSKYWHLYCVRQHVTRDTDFTNVLGVVYVFWSEALWPLSGDKGGSHVGLQNAGLWSSSDFPTWNSTVTAQQVVKIRLLRYNGPHHNIMHAVPCEKRTSSRKCRWSLMSSTTPDNQTLPKLWKNELTLENLLVPLKTSHLPVNKVNIAIYRCLVNT